MSQKKVFVSGCYDLLHSGHVEFFMQASRFGDLYVGIGSDATYLEYKHRKPMFPQEERLFMVKSIRYVKDAFINAGSGVIDYLPTLDLVRPDIFVVNAEGGSDEKRRICEERGIQYVELQRTPHEGLQARSSSSLKAALGAVPEKKEEEGIPTRIDIAGTWIDQPYVSVHHPGWAITLSVEPTFDIRDRWPFHQHQKRNPQDLACEAPEDGPRDACQAGILLREQSGAGGRPYLRCTGRHRNLHAGTGPSLL